MVSYLDYGGVEHLVKKILDRIQPVGSLYYSTNDTSPASLFGGTWERYAEGCVMVSASDTDSDFAFGKTGGSKTHSHWLPFGMEEITNGNLSVTWTHHDGGGLLRRGTSPGHHDIYGPALRSPSSNGTEERCYEEKALMPYISVYIWRRIS